MQVMTFKGFPLMLTLALLLLNSPLYSQRNVVCYAPDGSEISERKLKKLQRASNNALIIGTRKTEEGIEKVLMERRHRGQLEEQILQQIKVYTEDLTGVKLKDGQVIVIDYYPGKDRCNSSGSADRAFLRDYHSRYQAALKKEGNIVHLNIYKDKEGLKRHSIAQNWQQDWGQLIENTFFNRHFPCSNYLVLDLEGNYIVYYGESYWADTIADVQALRAKSEK